MLYCRLLLANAVRSGKVVMTLRRRKKRPAPPPPDYPENMVLSNRNSSPTVAPKHDSGFGHYTSKLSHSTDCISGAISANNGTQSKNSSTFTLNSIGDSADEFSGSMDDVFSDSGTDIQVKANIHPDKKQAYASNSNTCDKISCDKIGGKENNGNYVNVELADKHRTQSASAIDDPVQWKAVPININLDDVDYVNTAEMARRRRGKGLNSFNSNLTSDMTSYRSDPELVNIHRTYQKKSKKMYRLQERNGAQTPTSCCSSGSDGTNYCTHTPASKVSAVTSHFQ